MASGTDSFGKFQKQLSLKAYSKLSIFEYPITKIVVRVGSFIALKVHNSQPFVRRNALKMSNSHEFW